MFFTDQHRITHQRASFKPRNAVFGIDGSVIPDSGSVHNGMVINLADSGAIFFTGVADDHEDLTIECSL
ncbi:hypothetical protein D3C80_1705580 [compost metagenome]